MHDLCNLSGSMILLIKPQFGCLSLFSPSGFLQCTMCTSTQTLMACSSQPNTLSILPATLILISHPGFSFSLTEGGSWGLRWDHRWRAQVLHGTALARNPSPSSVVSCRLRWLLWHNFGSIRQPSCCMPQCHFCTTKQRPHLAGHLFNWKTRQTHAPSHCS